MGFAAFSLFNIVVIAVDLWLIVILMHYYRTWSWWAFPVLILLVHGLIYSTVFLLDTNDVKANSTFYAYWSFVVHIHDKTTILVYSVALLYNTWKHKLRVGNVWEFIKANKWRLLFPCILVLPLFQLAGPAPEPTPAVVIPLWIQIMGVVVPIVVSAGGLYIALKRSPFEIKKAKTEAQKEAADTAAVYQEMARIAAETERNLRAENAKLREEFEAYQKATEQRIDELMSKHEAEMEVSQKALDTASQVISKLRNYITILVSIIHNYDPDALIPDLDPKKKGATYG